MNSIYISLQVFVTSIRGAQIPTKKPLENAETTPSTKALIELIEHLELIISLDEQVNELVAKAKQVFSSNEDIPQSKRKPDEKQSE